MINNTSKYDFEVMVQIAKMYYQKNMNQQEIAKEFGWSRSTVSMILSEAKDCGIIEVRIYDPTANDDELSAQMKERFGLKECLVVPTSASSNSLLIKIVAGQAALFAKTQLKSHSSVGIAWGTTCQEFMNAFPTDSNLIDVNVVPLIGGSSRIGGEFRLNEMIRDFAEKVRGMPSFMYIPAWADTMEDKALYMKSMYMQDIVARWKNLDAIIISIGAPPEYYVGSAEGIDPYELLEKIREAPSRPIGDIVARRFNFKGEFIESDYDNRLMSIDEDSLRNVKNVICVAVGRHKAVPIIGALKMKFINNFVTDSETAQLILDLPME